MNWGYTTNSNYLILISLQPDCVNLLNIFQTLGIWSNRILSLKYLRYTIYDPLGCKAEGVSKSDFVAKNPNFHYFLTDKAVNNQNFVQLS